jgi:hypothetical protein
MELRSPAFRSLKGVQFPISFIAGSLHVCGHIAISITPFGGRIGKDETIFTGGKILDFLTTFTLLNDGMAGTTVKPAAFITHEKTLMPLFYTCTNHFNHVLS